ncbi:hypothetical protein VP1G_01734 [Cytospora mali]|uniref:Uncharacterized protein n=1 Tax=Cytospora mali TaxID=578113 RepID=A0A194URS2_CYTMA|nr:hypothetical protein VP1G_01734 [Valsa mali var. pyri (nom. inval.)]
MPDFKEIAKKHWHPDKNETSLRGQVGAVLGRKSGNDRDVTNYSATPLNQLRDPSTFAPPPKRLNSGEQGLLEDAPPPAPPRPYRVDTTGLSTAHLPPPPGRLDGADGRPPPPYSATVSSSNRPAPPSLPPRLPPRTNSASPGAAASLSSPEVPSRHAGYLNQGAVDRLSGAGVSVPGLGSMNDLRSRFSKFKGGFGSGSSTPEPEPAPAQTRAPAQAQAPSQGTTWAQKQAALKTMSDFKKDPKSVSLSDARSAASTANNFRERHGEQVASGVRTANSMDQKYGVSGKVGGYMANGSGGSGTETGRAGSPAQSHLNTISSAAGLLGKKKPPPPPPKKKPGLSGGSVARDDDAPPPPPPVPMSTRPF